MCNLQVNFLYLESCFYLWLFIVLRLIIVCISNRILCYLIEC